MSRMPARRGQSPLILSFPHVGTELPQEVEAALNDTGRALPDTDWHVDRLYDFADELDATVLRGHWSRYVVDLNRDPAGTSLYPGQTTTELCPTTTFDGLPIYQPGMAPDPVAVNKRAHDYFWPYHETLEAEIGRLKTRHGFVLLWDAHAIRSVIPNLFDGTLPILNIGTYDGRSCGPDLRTIVAAAAKTSPGLEYVVDGRFKGGWITRTYGRPAHHVFAIQLELALRAYMEEAPPWTLDEDRAAGLRPFLLSMIKDVMTVAGRLRHDGDPS